MPTYKIREDSGASKTIIADSMQDALQQACDWASEGSYAERETNRSCDTPMKPSIPHGFTPGH